MYEKFLSQFTGQAAGYSAPLTNVASVLMSNLEKFTRFHFDAVKSYTEIGLDQFCAASQVQDVDSLQRFVNEQSDLLVSVSKKVVEDHKVLSEMSENFASELQNVTKANIDLTTRLARPTIYVQ